MPDLKKMLTLEALSEALPSWLKRSTKPEYNADEIDSTLTTNQFVTASDKDNWNAKGTYSKPSGGIPKSDLSSIVQTSLEKADSALQNETDPTVPSWAKQTNKPSYTQDEVADGSTYKRVTQTEKDAWSGKQNALTTTQMQAVNSGITAEGVTQISTNKTSISEILDANGKKQLIPIFGTITNGNITYSQNGTAITVSGTKTAGTENYIAVYGSTPTYADLGLSAGDVIKVKNDNSNVYVAIIFWGSGGYSSTIPIQNETKEITLPSNKEKILIRIAVLSGLSSVNETIHPLICKKELFDVSSEVTPYAKSNYELTQYTDGCSLGTVAKSSGSLDNITKNSFEVYSASVTGKPVDNEGNTSAFTGLCKTDVYNSSEAMQTLTRLSNGHRWVRTKTAGTWNPWEQLGASCTTYSITPTAINTWTEVTRITIPANCVVKITASIGWDQDPVSGIKLTNETGTILAINEDRSSTNLGALTLTHIENTKDMSSGYTRVLYGEISRITGGGKTRVTVITEYVEC